MRIEWIKGFDGAYCLVVIADVPDYVDRVVVDATAGEVRAFAGNNQVSLSVTEERDVLLGSGEVR